MLLTLLWPLLPAGSKWSGPFSTKAAVDPLVAISCPQYVSDLVSLLQKLLLTLWWLSPALSMWVIWSFCYKITSWPFGGHPLPSDSKWSGLFAATYVADLLVSISCHQRVSDLVFFLHNLQLIYPLTLLDSQSFYSLYFVSYYWFCTLFHTCQIVCNILLLYHWYY